MKLKKMFDMERIMEYYEEKKKRWGLLESDQEIKNDMFKISGLVGSIWEGVDLTQIANVDEKNMERSMELVKDRHFIIRHYFRFSLHCDQIVEHPAFTNFITFVIVLAGVLVGLQTDNALVKKTGSLFNVLDLLVLIIFTIEIILKFIAAFDRPLKVFRSKWNTFDFLIVVASYVLGGGMIQMLRLLRLLRVLKLVRAFKQLQVIVNALLMGLNSIGFIAIIMIWTFYMFGVLGVIMFKDNDPWHFGSLHMAMLTLFHASTLEKWTVVMYINLYGCDQYGYDDDMKADLCREGTEPSGILSVIYFFIFVVIASMVLLTLFIGVVCMAMDEATQNQLKDDELEQQVQSLVDEEGITEKELEVFNDVFRILDLDEGGTVDIEELEMGLEMIGHGKDKSEIELMMSVVDDDGSGEIDFAEFIEFMIHMKKAGQMSEEEMDQHIKEEIGQEKKEDEEEDQDDTKEQTEEEEENNSRNPPPPPSIDS